MTVLIGASVLLVAASAIALVFGWANANESLIWTSIAASAGAGVALSLAYLGARRSGTSPTEATTAATEPPAQAGAPEVTARDERDETRREEEATAAPRLEATARKPARERKESSERKEPAATKKKTPPKTRPETPSAARVTSKPRSSPKEVATEVIALPDSKKYHRPECRYAKSKGAERMTKAAARRRSYSACGICKP